MPVPVELVVPFAQFAASTANWLVEVAKERKSPRERLAAHVLCECGLLVGGLHQLDRDGRRLAAPFARFDPDWTEQERRMSFDAISEYVHDLTTTASIRKSLAALTYYAENPDGLEKRLADTISDPLETIIDESRSILRETIDSGGLCRPDFSRGLDSFWPTVRDARTDPEARRVAEIVRRAFATDTRSLIEIEKAFGQLKGTILSEYPKLPPPTWAS